MTNLPPGFAYGMIAGQNQSIAKANAEIEKGNRTIDKLAADRALYHRRADEWKIHFAAVEAERDYLLGLLDDAYGEENNPARQQAYADPDELRIPEGPRKGQIVTKRDHVFLKKFCEVFNKHLLGKYDGKWLSFIRGDIIR